MIKPALKKVFFKEYRFKPELVINFALLFIIIFCFHSCAKRTKQNNSNETATEDSSRQETLTAKRNNKHQAIQKEAPDTIFGDTIWVYPYRNDSWTDTVTKDDFTAILEVHVDTTDYIIDTLSSSRGKRITIGFNHYYTINFFRRNKPWFTVSFNKKEHLESLIGGTDFWLESNLDVFRKLVYNSKYDKFVIEFDINPRYNFGSVYYFVFNTKGDIEYTGTSGTWGGGDIDGDSFLTPDNNAYVTCYEVYVFKSDSSLSIAEFASYAEKKTFRSDISEYQWLHGLRQLTKNTFLAVFARNEENRGYNALILNTDTLIVNRFRYYGIMEEMDAILFFKHDTVLKRYYLYDSDREKLISISDKDPAKIREIALMNMTAVKEDTMSEKKFRLIDFELFGTYRFYKAINDTLYYYDAGKLE